LKGKALFQPLRLALTGRMSGPDVGEQLQILSYAPHVIHPDTKDIFVPLHDRVETLRSLAAATD
jgi:glutamyl-tRNA synthetase